MINNIAFNNDSFAFPAYLFAFLKKYEANGREKSLAWTTKTRLINRCFKGSTGMSQERLKELRKFAALLNPVYDHHEFVNILATFARDEGCNDSFTFPAYLPAFLKKYEANGRGTSLSKTAKTRLINRCFKGSAGISQERLKEIHEFATLLNPVYDHTEVLNILAAFCI